MDTVRAKNTGTFDHSTNTWRVRGKGVQVSIRQLSKRYGVDIPKSERESRPYWRRYLQDIEDGHRIAQRASSPLQDRIRSIEAMIVRLRLEGRSESDFDALKAMLAEAVAVPGHDIDHADVPVCHPAVESTARLIGVDQNAVAVGLLNNLIPTPPKPTKDGITHEATVYIERHKARGHKGWYQVRQAIDLLVEHTGDIALRDVTVHHWRAYYQAVKDHEDWGDTTKSNMLQTARTFLERVEGDHGLNYGFVRNKDYIIRRPHGQKVQYTVEQVKTALRHATGDVRYALLIGLNCGSYWSDIKTMTATMLQGGHLVRSRAKLTHKPDAVVGSWYLWPETRACINFTANARKVQDAYHAFRVKHGIPEHKALRKTTTQIIEDRFSDKEARLFRGEGGSDTHNRNYVRSFTPEQVRKLDDALQFVAGVYGLAGL